MRLDIKHIVILVHPFSTMLNIASPIEVFQTAIDNMDKLEQPARFTYQIHVVSAIRSKRIAINPGISINCESTFRDIDYPIDTLMVAGAPINRGFNKEALKWLKQQSAIVRRICSMCAGAFILAEAGVLAHKRAVTHWNLCSRLAEEYPNTDVDMDAIFVKDDNVYTSAGVTAGLDLSLALLEEDLGKDFALYVAKIMVLFLKRPGNQTQYSTVLESQRIDYKPLENTVQWIYQHLDEDISVERLADIAMMSARNFARVFVKELKMSPMKYVEKLRTETACRYLTQTNLSMDDIAKLSGLKTSLNMNRIFLKAFKVTPSQYKKHFSSAFS